MKKFINITAIMLCMLFLAVSCSKDNVGAKYSDNNPASFSLTGATTVTKALAIEEPDCDITLSTIVVTRASSNGEATVNFATSVDGEGTITVDPIVFATGENSKSPVAHIKGVPQGANTKFKVALPGTDVKAAEAIAGKTTFFTISVSRAKPASWEPVETSSIFCNGLFSAFFGGPSDHPTTLIYPVAVEKRTDANVFRIKNIAKSETCPFIATTQGTEMELYDLEGDVYYEIDATNQDFVEVKRQPLNIECIETYQGETTNYGMVTSGTDYSGFSATYKVGGKYDASTGKISFAIIYFDLAGMPYTSGYFWDGEGTELYLDDSNMGDDFMRDYTFSPYVEDTYFINAAFEYSNIKSIYKGEATDPSKAEKLAEKYGTVYAVPAYLIEDYDIFFNINMKGKLALPDTYKMQDLGVQVLSGVEAYMAVKSVEVGEELAINTITYDIVDKDGNVLGADFTDQFMQLGNEEDLSLYEGNYTCDGESSDNPDVQIVNEEDTLWVSGLCKYGPFKFVPDELTFIPSFVGDMVNANYKLYAYPSDGALFYMEYMNLFNFRRLIDGTLIPVLTNDAKKYGMNLIWLLQIASSSPSFVKAYNFTDFKLVPAEEQQVESAKKVEKESISASTTPTFNGKPVVMESAKASLLKAAFRVKKQ